MSAGFVQVPREVLSAEWFRQAPPSVKALLLLLLELANWRETVTRRGEALKPGQLVTSWAALAQRLAWTENGKREVPTVRSVRWWTTSLRNAGAVSWTATGTRAGAGLLISLKIQGFSCDSERTASGVAAGVTSRTHDVVTSTPEKDQAPAAVAAEPSKSHPSDPSRPGLTPRVRRILEDADRREREGIRLIEEEEARQRGIGGERTH